MGNIKLYSGVFTASSLMMFSASSADVPANHRFILHRSCGERELGVREVL